MLKFLSTLVFLSVPFSVSASPHQPITNQLIQLVKQRPEIKRMLIESIAKAKQVNPDKASNPVQSLAAYYVFLDKYVQLLPGELLKDPAVITRYKVSQGIAYYYFLVDQPLAELKNKGYYRNSLQYYPPFSKWLVAYAKVWGTFLNSKESWSDKIYKEFYDAKKYHLNMGWYGHKNIWTSFNDFFARHVVPGSRPLAGADDSNIVVSGVDCVPKGAWPINKKSEFKVAHGIKLKYVTYYNVGDFFKSGSPYKDKFAGGVMTHCFLNVNDYHRYHFPVSGVVKSVGRITKNIVLNVAWDKRKKEYLTLDASGWQFSQTRGFVIVKTKKHGLVAIIPVGMAQVSSINFDPSIRVDSFHKKGSELGYFHFGGSDYVMLFQKQAHFILTAPENDDGSFQHILMGQEYGIFK